MATILPGSIFAATDMTPLPTKGQDREGHVVITGNNLKIFIECSFKNPAISDQYPRKLPLSRQYLDVWRVR